MSSAPLPAEGLLCVEASAGTGKTHRLSTLAARWLVERDLACSALLVVTFTVVAARELRERIRERLVEVRDALASPGELPDGLDWLAAGDPTVLLGNAERALASFDATSISTIHGFAAAALAATTSSAPSDARRARAVADVLAKAAFRPDTAFLGADRARSSFDRTVELALDNPDVQLAPREGSDAPTAAALQASLVREAIERFDERGRRESVRTFSDLLRDLDGVLRDPQSPLLGTLRERYAVGLIDEFQDTDPLQWRILRRVFLDAPGRVLVVVGDPKQAIYGFRGADVDTYLEARAQADPAAGGLGIDYLTVNYRSDPAMLRALNGLLAGATLDEAGAISYQSVEPAPTATDGNLSLGGTPLAPLSIRVATDSVLWTQRLAIAADCAAQAQRLLRDGRLCEDGAWRAVTESDLVVLCGSRREFGRLREAFGQVGIRTTEARSDDVLVSPAALDVRVALRAMRDPFDARMTSAVAHCWLGEATSERLGAAGTRALVAEWCEALAQRGPVALARLLVDPAHTPGLLALPGGERLVTDVVHLLEVVASAAPPDAGPSQLLETLEQLAAVSREYGEEDVRTRRIDTDEPAVKLMTVHGAKGLEFPIVLCPSLQVAFSDGGPPLWRDERAQVRVLDAAHTHAWTDDELAASTPEARKEAAARATAGDRRRALYVALTRAKHLTVLWWEHNKNYSRTEELTSLLLDREDGRLVQRARPERRSASCYSLDGTGALAQLRAQLHALVDDGLVELGEVRVEHAPDVPATAGRRTAARPDHSLGVASIGRPLRERPTRCSFSSLVAHETSTATLDELMGDRGADDEGASGSEDVVADGTVAAAAAAGTPSLFADPFGGARGTAFGSAVHEALESAMRRDEAQSFDDALGAALPQALERWRVEVDHAVVQRGLLRAARVPIGGGASLSALAVAECSAELRFELPVADGVTVQDLAGCLLRHEPSGPYRAWAETVASWPTVPLAASLVGSIDLATSLGTERFHVVDYKTNLLEGLGYSRDGLDLAMRASDYPLQALLYLVALHRLLRWRRRDYDPSRDLGGAHYLFLRGMGLDGSGDGVATWSPPPSAVAALSELLAGADAS